METATKIPIKTKESRGQTMLKHLTAAALMLMLSVVAFTASGAITAHADSFEKKLEDHAATWLTSSPEMTVRELKRALFLHRMAVARHSVDQQNQITDDPDDNMIWRVQWSAFTAAANTLAYSCSFTAKELTDKAAEKLFEAPGAARVETWLAGIAAKDLGCHLPERAHN